MTTNPRITTRQNDSPTARAIVVEESDADVKSDNEDKSGNCGKSGDEGKSVLGVKTVVASDSLITDFLTA